MNKQTSPQKSQPSSSNLRTFLLFILPVLALAGVIALFLNTGGLKLSSPAPVEDLTIERYTLSPGNIDIYVRNSGPQAVTIAQAVVNAGVWPVTVTPSPTIQRLGRAHVHLGYTWNLGEAYAVTLFTSNSIPFSLEIPVAFTTPQPSSRTFWSFALIGLYVGVIPVFLGIFWFPALRRLGGGGVERLARRGGQRGDVEGEAHGAAGRHGRWPTRRSECRADRQPV